MPSYTHSDTLAKGENNMDKKLFRQFMTRKVAIHVASEEDWDAFMKLLEDKTDIDWIDGCMPSTYNEYDFDKFGDFCISSDRGKCLSYNNKQYYTDEGYKIIEFSDLIKDEEN